MREIVKKSFLLGLGAATITKREAEKVVSQLVKRNAISVNQGKEMLKKVKKHVENESKRLGKYAEMEAKRLSKEWGMVSKDKVQKIKRGLNVLDRELTSEGKKTFKKIMKELSR